MPNLNEGLNNISNNSSKPKEKAIKPMSDNLTNINSTIEKLEKRYANGEDVVLELGKELKAKRRIIEDQDNLH